MRERGVSPGPIKMLEVASWRKLRPSQPGTPRGQEAAKYRLPNMRVQRTRSSPSALREPLTRHPLGRTRRITATVVVCAVLAIFSAGCASARSPESLVVFNQSGAPQRIEIRFDDQVRYQGL